MDGGHSLMEHILRDENAEATNMPISLLKSITNNFADDQEIGCGGFAVVYKGRLENGAVVAVKKLSKSILMDEDKYNQEVSFLLRIKHRNIVRFLGYCADTQGKMVNHEGKFVMADVRERLLCFEYVPNGTLNDYITDASNGLDWGKRYQIIKGICEGLNYLHENGIVHLDLKPANILLDDDLVPKIADFGISRCFDQDKSWVTATKVVGTLGYLAPESEDLKITSKFDIYSLGVIMREILTGKKGYSSAEAVTESWHHRLKTSSSVIEEIALEQIRVCSELSMECLHFNPEKRPTTQHIMKLLMQTECVDALVGTDVQLQPGSETRFNDDEMPPATSAGSTNDLVTINRVSYFKDDVSVTADILTALVYMEATSSTAVREGLDLVAVLDVSGSMIDDGWKMDCMKEAMLLVITKLTPLDRLSIVTFSYSGATSRLCPLRSMTPAAQDDLKTLVAGLQAPKGGTNIRAGLETGLAVIADRVNTKARTPSILLMSGGHQTSGDARLVDPGQVAIHTFGFGKDTDHRLMSDIAMRSPGGTFSSVPHGGFTSITSFDLHLSMLLDRLLTVVAPYNTEDGDVDTIAVDPGDDKYTQDTDAATGEVTVKLGTLFAGEVRRVLITFTLKDMSATNHEEYYTALAKIQHSFTAQGMPRFFQAAQDIQVKRTLYPSQPVGR